MSALSNFFNNISNLSPEQNRGLLEAAAQILQGSSSGRPFSLGQAAATGGVAFHESMDQQRARGQQSQLRGLQIKGAEAELAQQQRALERQQALSAAAQRAYRTPGTQAASLPGGPTPENAARIGEFEGGFDTQSYINQVMAIDPAMGFQLQQSLKKVGPKYDSGITWVNGPDGQPVAVRTADDGSVKTVDGGYLPREKLEFRDGGNALYGIDQFTGEQRAKLAKGASPDALLSAATQREGFARADARAERANPANKPLPAGALKMQQTELDALATASGIDGQLERIQGQLDGGTLSFGPVSNLINQARNAAGMSNEESRNLASFRSTLEKLRNDSLRLNAGVQTDGDAQRAWNELFTNLNDTDLVKQRLIEIRGINQRAAQLRKLNVDGIRANYGHEPLDTSQYEQPAAAPTQQPRQAAAGGKVATLSDIAATARASGRSTAEVTAALRAKGYTIGGQ